MKKLTKWLALFLAGSFILTSLAACKNKDEAQDDDEEQSEKEESGKKTDKSKYKLSPEEVYDELLEAEEVGFSFETTISLDGESMTTAVSIDRDGDKMKSTLSDGVDELFTSYSDMAEGKEYYEEAGQWYWTATAEEVTWEEGIRTTFEDSGMDLKTLFFDDDSYDKKGSKYTIKEDVIAEVLGAPDGEIEGSMESDKATYNFLATYSEGDTWIGIAIEVVFEDKTIELPEATEKTGETPLTGMELYEWMDQNYALDYEVDFYEAHSSTVNFFWDAPFYGLFDDIYEYDAWGSGKMGYSGDYAAFYWSMFEPVTLNGYVLYTGNDSDEYPGRNPVSWYLFGTNGDFYDYTYENDPEELLNLGWELLDYVEDGNMEDVAGEGFGYMIDERAQGEYKHYCWFVVDGGDKDSLVQVNGLRLYAESYGSEIPDDPIDPDDPTIPDYTINEWDDAWGSQTVEQPMIDEEVEEWMRRYELLNDLIDMNSLMSSTDLFFMDGPMYNLFDEYFSMSDWSQGVRDGWIYSGYGSLGKMGYTGPQASFYWEMEEAVTLGSYVIYSGNDSATYTDRNPIGWFLLGSNNPDDFPMNNSVEALEEAGWVMLDAVFDGDMTNTDSKPFGYEIDPERQGAYRYYCWLVDYGGDGFGLVQVNGIKLFGTEEVEGGTTVTPPSDGDGEPMTGATVEEWMESHELVNNMIDPYSYENSMVGFFADGQLSNLFDDIYTEEEWNAAEADGLIYGDYGSLGKLGYTSEYFPAAFYWSMEEAVTLGSYVIYTGNDNAGNPGRNPLNWCLMGSNDPIHPDYADIWELQNYGWTILDQVEGSEMDDVNFTPYGYTIDEENQGEYQYYCWIVYDSNLLVQASGMKLYAAG